MPLATVILNCYNQASFLPEAIESALGQTVGDLELVLIDNGSTDGSRDVMARYEGEPRVRTIFHDENGPITRRLNEGVAAATSPFVSFLYSDDLLLPTKLERQLAVFAADDEALGVVYGPARVVNTLTGATWQQGSVAASGWVFESLMERHFAGQIDMISPLVRRACLVQHPFQEDIFAEGEGVFFRIALTHRFCYLDEALVVLRDHGANAGKAVRRNAEMTMVMLERLERHPDLPSGGARAVRRFRARLLCSYAWQAARLGEQRAWVRRCGREAVAAVPASALSPRLLGGLVIAHLPGGLRRRVNVGGDVLRSGPGNNVLVDGLGGGDDG